MNSLVPETSLKRIVIIGGGFGGIELAKRLSKKLYQVVLLDKNNYHTFQPLLYQVATGGLEPDSIAYPIRKIFSGYQNFIFRMAEVYSVRSKGCLLETDLGEIKYDYLVLATGSTTNFFSNIAFENNSMPLKSVPDALNLRSLLLQNFEKLLTEKNVVEREKHFHIVVVGGGPTGVEIAGALAELKKHVLPIDYPELKIEELNIHLVESSGKLLAAMSDNSSKTAQHFLKKMGVQLHLNTAVTSYINETAILNPAGEIKCSTFIWTAGVKGQLINGFKDDAVTKSSRLKVDSYNRITGYDSIFAIGDLAAMKNADKEAYPMLAPVAIQQAKNLARNLNLQDNRKWNVFNYKDLGSMATIGRNKAVADFHHLQFRGMFAWLIWMFVHLMSIVGFRNRIVVLVNWMWNYFSYDRAIRLIIRPYKKNTNV